jgi:D-glycero-alpha-D-manno-heptose 1-phosphate guanylyltransferase
VSLAPDHVTAVVLAGGFGTRIQHLLRELPKPMAPVLGRPFIEWTVRYLAAQGIRNVLLSTGYLAETIERHFQSQPVSGVSIQSVRETQPLGTAGGFLNAVNAAQTKPDAWLVLNGDSLALAHLDGMFSALSETGFSGALLGVPMTDAARYGTIEVNSAGELVAFNEKRPGAGTINAGVYLFRSSVVELFSRPGPLSFEKEVFPELAVRKARLKVCVTQAPFLDIGTPESLPLAEAFIREHQNFF